MARITNRELVTALLYFSGFTRPDISFPVSGVSMFVCNPGMIYWNAVIGICQYLKLTMNFGLYFDGKVVRGGQVYGYSELDLDGDVDERRSRSEYAIF